MASVKPPVNPSLDPLLSKGERGITIVFVEVSCDHPERGRAALKKKLLLVTDLGQPEWKSSSESSDQSCLNIFICSSNI